jgi:hypothetical protein
MSVGELLPKIFEGAVGKEAVILDFISNGAIPLWAPVILASPGTGEDLARVATTTSAGSTAVIGVAVGPVKASGNCADGAGEKVLVCVWGRCKVKVAGAVSVGALLGTSTTAGKATTTSTAGAILGKALAAASTDGDIIPVFVMLG